MGELKPREWEYNWEEFRKSLTLLKKSIELVENNEFNLSDDLAFLLIDGVFKRFKDTYEHALDVLGVYVSSIYSECVVGHHTIIYRAMEDRIIREKGWLNIVEYSFYVMGEHNDSEKRKIYKHIVNGECKLFEHLDKRLYDMSLIEYQN